MSMKIFRIPLAGILALCLALSLTLTACTPRTTRPSGPGGDASRSWQAFMARSTAVEKGSSPYRINANLRYTANGKSQRVSSFLWGNATKESPIRLDLVAGGTAIVAKIIENSEVFTAYIPDENTAWYHPRGDYALAAFGVPIPLTLQHLGLLLTGRAGQLFLPHSASGLDPARSTETENGFSFTIADAPLPGTLEVSPEGVPLSWKDSGGDWLIVFEPAADAPMRPRRLKISHPAGYEAIVVVTGIEYPEAPFTQRQLNLDLPESAKYKPIEEAHAGN